jgi:hypothetical protein
MNNLPLRLRRSLVLAMAMPLMTISGAQADSEGYLDNWSGDTKVELRALGLAQSGFGTFPAPDPHESLSAQFNRIWSAPTTQKTICDRARAQVEQNRGLHRGANQFAKMIQTLRPELGFPSRFFDLSAFIDGNRSFETR